MKILITLIFLPFLLVSVGNANEWILAWSDEFNYEGQPDSDIWRYEEGFIRNGEVGYFTDRLKNVRVEDGLLVIEAHKETYKNEAYKAGSTDWREEREFADYTAGSITTRGKKTFKYGRFEVRAKMPYGQGSHVGIWFLGTNVNEIGWPGCGEVGIMEYVGREPNTIHYYTHYADLADPTKIDSTAVGKPLVMNPYDNFHIYAIEWNEKEIKYFIDNTQVATFNLDIAGTGSDNPFRKEQVLYLTDSLGGWGWGVDGSVLPQKFEIDYVRVYRERNAIFPIYNLLLHE